jgi:hypothetical protein
MKEVSRKMGQEEQPRSFKDGHRQYRTNRPNMGRGCLEFMHHANSRKDSQMSVDWMAAEPANHCLQTDDPQHLRRLLPPPSSSQLDNIDVTLDMTLLSSSHGTVEEAEFFQADEKRL